MPSDADKLPPEAPKNDNVDNVAGEPSRRLSADSGAYLHPRMPKLGSIQLSGRSGCRYDFRVYVWGHQFKPVPAVYVITERRLEPDGVVQYLPVYVGETNDLSRVFEYHPCNECFLLYLANTVAAFAEEDPQTRKAIVLDLLSGIKPPCNQIANVGAAQS